MPSPPESIASCMADPAKVREYPDPAQRAAVCYRQGGMAQLSAGAGDPAALLVVTRRPDGSALVYMPIMRAGTVDLARTASKATGTRTITTADLDAVARNMAAWPQQLPVHFDEHRDHSETGGEAPAFLERTGARVIGDELWVYADLNAESARKVVDNRGYRGFSVDYGPNGWDLPLATFDEPVVTGGIFTNRSALDVHFKLAPEVIAASATDRRFHIAVFSSVGEPIALQESDMPEVKKPEDQLAAKDQELAALKAKATDAETKLAAALSKLDAATKTTGDKDAQIAQLTAAVQKQGDNVVELSTRVTGGETKELVTSSIDAGVDAKMFDVEGQDVIKDPGAWLKARYPGVTDPRLALNLLRGDVARYPKVSLGQRNTTSGAGAGAGGDASAKLDAAVRKIQAERKLSYNDAITALKTEQPDLYRAAAASYRSAEAMA